MFQYVKTKGGLQVSIYLRGMWNQDFLRTNQLSTSFAPARGILQFAWPVRQHWC